MNTKMKKAVAGVVLGTFAFGAATPAFAETTGEVVAVANYTYQTELVAAEIIAVEGIAPAAEESKGKVALEVLKRVLLDNWDDIPLLKSYTALKTTLFDLINKYYDVCDTIEELLRTSISEAFGLDPDGVAVSVAITAIMLLLPV